MDTSVPTSIPTSSPSGMEGCFINVHALPNNFYGLVQIFFLGSVYAYVLCYSSNMISDGSELLLLIKPVAGMVGSIVLPVLGAVPDGAIVLFSGMGPGAQQQLSVGIGALAGSTIMLLTMPWFLCILGGRVNISQDGECDYKEKLNPADRFGLFDCGVKLAPSVNNGAYWMLGTALSFLVIQIPALVYSKEDSKELSVSENLWAGIAMYMCIFCFFAYLYYQYYITTDEGKEKSRLDFLRKAIAKGEVSLCSVMAAEIRHFNLDQVKNENSSLNDKEKCLAQLELIMYPFFKKYDTDKSGQLDTQEIAALLRDMKEKPTKDERMALFAYMDKDKSGFIDYKEFVKGVYNYVLMEMRSEKKANNKGANRIPSAKSLNDEEDEDEEEVPDEWKDLPEKEQIRRALFKSTWMMLVGTFIVLLFSDPMVDVLNEIGLRTGIDPFYVAFVLAPLASNASELIASYNYAQKKTAASISISLAALQGACCMNNTFVLGIFMVLVYTQGLSYAFFAETSSILLVIVIMAAMSFKKNHNIFDAFFIISLYPLSLVFVATLESFGWD